MIYDLEKMPYSDRHGTYGGRNGDKDGIIIDSEYWIVKFPKRIKGPDDTPSRDYTNLPLSEYLGSHIYQILGYETHETILGIRHNKIVVGCKDFCLHRGDLAEMRTIRNAANEQLSKSKEIKRQAGTLKEGVDLNEIICHFDVNPILKDQTALQERFWDTVIIDTMLNNSDRRNGNLGLLWLEKERKYVPAPLYDNGNAFDDRISEKLLEGLQHEYQSDQWVCDLKSPYVYNGKRMTGKSLFQVNIPALKESVLRVVPKIVQHMPEITSFIFGVEEEYNGHVVCSEVRKKLYQTLMQNILDEILLPAYKELNPTR